MISIIIPIYNTAQYLNRCIQSVLKSSCKDFELLLINDGSMDASGRICRRYCRRDERVRYYEQEHRGVSAARNKGIAESRGEWIVFIDSDDFISGDFLKSIAQERYQSEDLLIFDSCRVGKKKNGTDKKKESDCSRRLSNTQLIDNLLNMKPPAEKSSASLPSPCAKAYKKSVIDRYQIRFPSDIVIGEDRLFNIHYFLRITSYTYIPRLVYYVNPRPDSAMRGFHPDFLENDIKYQKYLRHFLIKHSLLPQLKESYYNSVLTNMADVLIRSVFHPCNTGNYRESCSLCNKMQEFPIYRNAMSYNCRTGAFPRKLLVFFFGRKCYPIVNMICRISYRVLKMTGNL